MRGKFEPIYDALGLNMLAFGYAKEAAHEGGFLVMTSLSDQSSNPSSPGSIEHA